MRSGCARRIAPPNGRAERHLVKRSRAQRACDGVTGPSAVRLDRVGDVPAALSSRVALSAVTDDLGRRIPSAAPVPTVPVLGASCCGPGAAARSAPRDIRPTRRSDD